MAHRRDELVLDPRGHHQLGDVVVGEHRAAELAVVAEVRRGRDRQGAPLGRGLPHPDQVVAERLAPHRLAWWACPSLRSRVTPSAANTKPSWPAIPPVAVGIGQRHELLVARVGRVVGTGGVERDQPDVDAVDDGAGEPALLDARRPSPARAVAVLLCASSNCAFQRSATNATAAEQITAIRVIWETRERASSSVRPRKNNVGTTKVTTTVTVVTMTPLRPNCSPSQIAGNTTATAIAVGSEKPVDAERDDVEDREHDRPAVAEPVQPDEDGTQRGHRHDERGDDEVDVEPDADEGPEHQLHEDREQEDALGSPRISLLPGQQLLDLRDQGCARPHAGRCPPDDEVVMSGRLTRDAPQDWNSPRFESDAKPSALNPLGGRLRAVATG